MTPEKHHETDFEYRYTEAGGVIVTGCGGGGGEVRVPPVLGGRTVRGIGPGAFRFNEDATGVLLPDTLTAIGEGAFFGCRRLARVFIPRSVVRIDGNPFAGCDALAGIAVDPANPRFRVTDGVLWDADPVDPRVVCYPGGKTDASYTLPAGTGYVGKQAFFGNCHLQRVALSDDVGAIQTEAFSQCAALREVVFPARLHRIGTMAFFRCPCLEEAILPDSLEELGIWAFAACGALSRVRLSKGLNRFSISAFRDCDRLRSLVVPEGVRELRIDDRAALPPGAGKAVWVPLSVERVENEDEWQGAGYTFHVPRSRLGLWSRRAFAGQDIRLRVKWDELAREGPTLRGRIRRWLWKLRWGLGPLCSRSGPWAKRRFRIVPIRDGEAGGPEDTENMKLTSGG